MGTREAARSPGRHRGHRHGQPGSLLLQHSQTKSDGSPPDLRTTPDARLDGTGPDAGPPPDAAKTDGKTDTAPKPDARLWDVLCE